MKLQLDILGFTPYDLPDIEQDISVLTTKQITTTIREFYHRFEKSNSEDVEFTPIYFMQLLANYPVSMCSKHMTDSLQLLIAMSYYAHHKKAETKKKKDEFIWYGFTMEDLSLIYVRSKASIHNAVRDYGAKAKDRLGVSELRTEAKKIALSQLIAEEKAKLEEKKAQTTELTAK